MKLQNLKVVGLALSLSAFAFSGVMAMDKAATAKLAKNLAAATQGVLFDKDGKMDKDVKAAVDAADKAVKEITATESYVKAGDWWKKAATSDADQVKGEKILADTKKAKNDAIVACVNKALNPVMNEDDFLNGILAGPDAGFSGQVKDFVKSMGSKEFYVGKPEDTWSDTAMVIVKHDLPILVLTVAAGCYASYKLNYTTPDETGVLQYASFGEYLWGNANNKGVFADLWSNLVGSSDTKNRAAVMRTRGATGTVLALTLAGVVLVGYRAYSNKKPATTSEAKSN